MKLVDRFWSEFWKRQGKHLPHTVLIHNCSINAKDAPPGFVGIRIGELPSRNHKLDVKIGSGIV